MIDLPFANPFRRPGSFRLCYNPGSLLMGEFFFDFYSSRMPTDSTYGRTLVRLTLLNVFATQGDWNVLLERFPQQQTKYSWTLLFYTPRGQPFLTLEKVARCNFPVVRLHTSQLLYCPELQLKGVWPES